MTQTTAATNHQEDKMTTPSIAQQIDSTRETARLAIREGVLIAETGKHVAIVIGRLAEMTTEPDELAAISVLAVAACQMMGRAS